MAPSPPEVFAMAAHRSRRWNSMGGMALYRGVEGEQGTRNSPVLFPVPPAHAVMAAAVTTIQVRRAESLNR